MDYFNNVLTTFLGLECGSYIAVSQQFIATILLSADIGIYFISLV